VAKAHQAGPVLHEGQQSWPRSPSQVAAHNAHMLLPTDLHRELAELFGAGRGWLTDPGERLAYAYDNSRRESLPDAVALPVNREQVQAVVAAAPIRPAHRCRCMAAWWSRSSA
jgi:hypothetical protein